MTSAIRVAAGKGARMGPNIDKPFRLASGGKERQDSVWNGLAA